jgi:hypothetical protein
MFVVTMEADMSPVKLKYEGTAYGKEGNYTIKYNGGNKAMPKVVITVIKKQSDAKSGDHRDKES